MIPTEIIANVSALDKPSADVRKEFRRLLASGYHLRIDGRAKSDPGAFLKRGYMPKYEISLFGVRYFLCDRRNSEGLKVMSAFVLPAQAANKRQPTIYARVFYKDSSLVWRSASHYVNTEDEHWIGKGAVRWLDKRGDRGWYSAEETTNLPFEIQAALDDISQRGPSRRTDNQILSLVLRNAPSNRVSPYQDFQKPRDVAMSVPANQINENQSVAWFSDEDDPRSLQFVAGFAPDFGKIIGVSDARSTMYGGAIRKFRIASENRRIQYLFVAGPTHVWIVCPQPFTTELSSFGLRTVDAVVDEDLLIPGYEFYDNERSGEMDDQIPPGFAGDVCPVDPDRADASPWNELLPVVKEFRKTVLGR